MYDPMEEEERDGRRVAGIVLTEKNASSLREIPTSNEQRYIWSEQPTATPKSQSSQQADPLISHFISEESLLLLVAKTLYDSSLFSWNPMETNGTLYITNIFVSG